MLPVREHTTPRRVRAYAHRGGARHPQISGLENTLAAFRHAVSLGYTYLETDVHLTRDGVLLAFHDPRLDRVTDARGAIAEMSYAEAARARVGGEHPVPTMRELLDAFPEARFNIDLKADGTPLALAELLAATGSEARAMVGSFSVPRLQEFRRITAGRVQTSAHPREVAAYLLAPSAFVARRLAPGPFAALQIPHRQRIRGRLVTVANRGLVRRAHASGKEVHVWTVDDPAEMRELIDLGVDGLMTDRTDVLKEVLQAAGLWEGSDTPPPAQQESLQ